MEQREKDIQALCEGVLGMGAEHYDNPNGGYESNCPFCDAFDSRGGGKGRIWAAMSELEHETNCIYLIAKDLSTRS